MLIVLIYARKHKYYYEKHHYQPTTITGDRFWGLSVDKIIDNTAPVSQTARGFFYGDTNGTQQLFRILALDKKQLSIEIDILSSDAIIHIKLVRSIFMTMHLEVGLSTIRTSKPKQRRLTKTKLKQYQQELREHNKILKQSHRHDECLSLDQYINWIYGKTGKTKPEKYKTANEVKTYEWKPQGYRRSDASHIPSKGVGGGNALAQEKKEYTGTLIKGIATMHKSNAVPIINDEEAKDISRMRRG